MGELVTLFGGGGFIGRYVAQELLKRGARVRIAERDPSDAYFLKPLGGLGQTQFVHADLTKPTSVRRAVEGATGVVNLVGLLAGRFEAIHVDGARAVAEAATAAGAGALVQISAIGADAASPAAYARTKAGGEAAVRKAFPRATIVRPSIVFGPEDAFLNRFAGLIGKLPVVPVMREGVRFQPVWVADLARAIAEAALDPGTYGGRTFELGGPQVMTMGEINRWIAGAIGRKSRFVAVPDVAGAALAKFGGWLPGAPITWDQWLLLQHDNVAGAGAEGFAPFGIDPKPLAAVAPAWLVRFRRQGRFGLGVPA